MTIAEAKEKNRLPEYGTPVQIQMVDQDTKGFFVATKHLVARKNAPGIYIGYVPGAGGDLWWVQHEGGEVGAYLFTEVSDKE